MITAIVVLVLPLVIIVGGGFAAMWLTDGLARTPDRCECGYDVRGLAAGVVCPECGRERRVAPAARGWDVLGACGAAWLMCVGASVVTFFADASAGASLLASVLLMPGMLCFVAAASRRVSQRWLAPRVVWWWGLASGAGAAAVVPIYHFGFVTRQPPDAQAGLAYLLLPFLVHYVSVPAGLAVLGALRWRVWNATR
jgi:hypothetical protein